LGKVPKFAKYIESLTEELEEQESDMNNKRELFLGLTFVDKKTLEDLNAIDLIGSKYLKPHMHG